jgi:TnpA family transposase
LLTDEERRLLLGVPRDPDSLARHYTLTRSDQELVSHRRGAANRLGFAVQLALLRHPGRALPNMDEPVDALVGWLAAHLELPVAAFTEYARRPQTMTDHARVLADTLDAHHLLPIAVLWGDGSTSSSDGQFFRSGKRGRHAGDINARHGTTPGLSFYTHVSDQHGPYNIRAFQRPITRPHSYSTACCITVHG